MRDKLIRIKRSRLKPEELFLIDILNDIIIRKDEFSDGVYWDKDGYTLFKSDFEDGFLYVDYDRIWSILESHISCDFIQIQSFIKML